MYYVEHGMICLTKQEKKIELLLFGGLNSFVDSFIKVSIVLQDNIVNINYYNSGDKLKLTHEKIILKKGIQLDHQLNRFKHISMKSFGYVSILNMRNERVIIIIGGENNSKSILLYNVEKKQLSSKMNVCGQVFFFFCNAMFYRTKLIFGFFFVLSGAVCFVQDLSVGSCT